MTTLIPIVNIPPQSHSSLQTFELCPRQYEAKYVLRNVKFQPSYESEWGDRAHQYLENYLKASGKFEIPSEVHKDTKQNMRDYQWAGDALLTRAQSRGGYVLAERKFALDHEKDTADYWDKTCWLRGKIDVTIIYPQQGEAEVYDFKTGKKKDDPDQCILYSASAMVDYGNVSKVRAGYIWLKLPADKAVDKPMTFTRADLPNMFRAFDAKYFALQDAYESGVFPPKPNGLCKNWCDVPCEFNGRGIR